MVGRHLAAGWGRRGCRTERRLCEDKIVGVPTTVGLKENMAAAFRGVFGGEEGLGEAKPGSGPQPPRDHIQDRSKWCGDLKLIQI